MKTFSIMNPYTDIFKTTQKPNPIYMPTQSQRIKNKVRRKRNGTKNR